MSMEGFGCSGAQSAQCNVLWLFGGAADPAAPRSNGALRQYVELKESSADLSSFLIAVSVRIKESSDLTSATIGALVREGLRLCIESMEEERGN